MWNCVKNKVQNSPALFYRENLGQRAIDATTFVFLHGNGFSSRVFKAQLTSAEFADHRVLAFDLPGHGASDAFDANTPYNFETMGTALLKAFDALSLVNITLVGWSLGGHIALDMLDRSPRIDRAIICGAPPMHRGPLPSLRAYHFTRDMLLASKRQFTQNDAERFEKLCLGQAADGGHVSDLMNVDPAMRASIAKSVLNGVNRDQYVLATTTKKPLLIVHGDADPLVHTAYISNFARSVDYRGQFELIRHAGHAPFMDQAEAFNRCVLQFAMNSKLQDVEDNKTAKAA
ncbi:MAG: alpha/beta hydrolase [Ahrensia sp.]|nr:alpha/beta hydrolase [Ahrensia sp.]